MSALTDPRLRIVNSQLEAMHAARDRSAPKLVDVVREGQDRLPHRLVRVTRELQLNLFGRQVRFFYEKTVQVDLYSLLDGEDRIPRGHLGHSSPSVGDSTVAPVDVSEPSVGAVPGVGSSAAPGTITGGAS